ncbi:putative periplasmic binding protein CbiK [Aggregatibacter actinomycetemcomitans serotype e str. SC1083]|uniref:Putative periplasmic binding protein CbiK n=1 Tax=Aggregatibacter actinomycetemcomitans serotype e str. SC1083 TaxID=907488 RepID=G4A839_AGGAC|nr:DUF4198 domain-containing protein [Aggregatibacter actinomycetemcomitans]EGY34005.1 putative periplasmic binding protein CbiK [Aggregatibacter actinomycetemcomitans serotype e str. SC1083]KYK82062.1 membrane protein [Aggregatibacter actinomycetemcomitans serotype e str. SC936]
MKFKKTTAMLTALFVASVANAHNIWLEPVKEANSAGQYVVKFGHEQTEIYPEHKLKAVKLLDSNGNLTNATHQFKQGEAYLNVDNASQVFVRFDNGIWSKLPNGKYVEKSKQQEPTAEFAVNPVKFGKALLRWDAQALKAHGMKYELVPQEKAQAGKPLPILVLHNGKPVKDIKVGLGEDAPFNLTNENGIAEFTPQKGNNKVWAEFAENVKDNPDYDRRLVEYMLTFEAE